MCPAFEGFLLFLGLAGSVVELPRFGKKRDSHFDCGGLARFSRDRNIKSQGIAVSGREFISGNARCGIRYSGSMGLTEVPLSVKEKSRTRKYRNIRPNWTASRE